MGWLVVVLGCVVARPLLHCYLRPGRGKRSVGWMVGCQLNVTARGSELRSMSALDGRERSVCLGIVAMGEGRVRGVEVEKWGNQEVHTLRTAH
jgi:hypothetical protein